MTTETPHAASEHTMQCMEVWGGNEPVDNHITMSGLDAWVRSLPYHDEAGGGDIHYLSSCATGRITRLLVADVSGHGAAVSSLAVRLRNLMRRYVNYIDQGRFVGALNREFAFAAEQSGSFGFATAIVATYWAPTEELALSNAGHPPPLWFRADRGQWEFLDDGGERRTPATEDAPTNLPLGIMEPTRYEQFNVRLAPADLLLIYTDSLPEAMGPDGRQLGEAGLLDMVQGLDTSRPADLIPSLIQRVSDFRQGRPADDDLTALLLRQNSKPPEQATILGGISTGWRYIGIALSMLRGKDRDPFPWPELNLTNVLGAFFHRFNTRRPKASEPSANK